MKNYHITFIALFLSLSLQAQIVNIPDANFKAALLAGNTTNQDFVFDFISGGAQGFFYSGYNIDLNNDGEIQVSEAHLVTGLFLDNSNINSLAGISEFVNLEYISCDDNLISTLDLSNNVDIEFISCNNNLIQNINVNSCLNLEYISCENNQLLDLDLSNNSILTTAKYVDNDLLVTINQKNGSGEFTVFHEFTPWSLASLQFICADEFEIENLNNIFLTNAMVVNVNPYCTFSPGGNYNNITGTSVLDLDNNGCDANDMSFPFLKLNIDDGIQMGSTFTNNNGEYNFYTQDGNFTLTPEFENPTFFNVTPIDVTINFPDNNYNTLVQDFCVIANGIHNDTEIVIGSTIPARPGFDAEYIITYKNKGNQALSGDFSFAYDDMVLDYVSATETPTSQSTGLLTWNYTNLLPFESRSVYVTLNVNGPMEIPAINIDDELNFTVIINPITVDESPNDNEFDYKQIVVGAYDPNDITCVEGDFVEPTQIGEYLHYIINFENTGNFPAQNIIVATEVDSTMFDIGTLQVLSSSHDANVKVTDNLVEIIFESIYLAASGQGNILLKVKTEDTLLEDETVTKNANIFFDYNFPVLTNDANTTFATLSASDFEIDASVSLYPNPVKDILIISAKNTIKNVSLFDVQGRVLLSKTNTAKQIKLDLSNRANGVYFVKITTDKGTNVEKIIKN